MSYYDDFDKILERIDPENDGSYGSYYDDLAKILEKITGKYKNEDEPFDIV